FQGFDLALARLDGAGVVGAAAPSADSLRVYVGVWRLIDAYRRFGHFAARIDPFGNVRQPHPSTALAFNGLSEADLDRVVDVGTLPLPSATTLRQLLEFLQRTYTGTVGAEFMQVTDEQERSWLLERFEGGRRAVRGSERAEIARQMIRSEAFELF